jgi:protein phosphatase
MWAGDSRTYRYRHGQLKLLTQDHALVEELVAQGMLTREEAAHHPQASLITRAVGAADRLVPDLDLVEVREGDTFLLCSDGLTREVTEESINAVLSDGSCTDAADALIEMALSAGARDNVTVVVVRAEADTSDGEPEPKVRAPETAD